jgi:Fuc2NAc and GlcNAc transferase
VNAQWLAFILATACAAAFTGMARWLAVRHGFLDYPNPRSAHASPLPLGGGAAIVLVVCAGLLVVPLGDGAGLVIAGCGAALAVVGFVDDRRGVPKWLRLLVQGLAVGVLIYSTRELGQLHVPGLPVGLVGALCLFVALIWLLNLYNFMDGIDGLAAAEAAIVCLGLALCLHLGAQGAPDVLLVCLLTAGAALGFLLWNWPPARIFMGDVGSGFLGFLLGALALVAHLKAGLSLWVPAILLAVFVADASLTLLRRMIRRERWYEPHRLHAYQWLSRRFRAHRPVTLIAIAIGVLWLTPLAVAAARRPEIAGMLAAIAYAPVVVGALLCGSGRPEAGTKMGGAGRRPDREVVG